MKKHLKHVKKLGNRKFGAIVGVLLLAFVLVSCGKDGEEAGPVLPAPSPMVQTLDLALPPTVSVSEIGTVKAVAEIELIARAAGTVDSLSLFLGQKVSAGQELGSIDSTGSNVAEVNLDTAQGQLSSARQNYDETLANNQEAVKKAGLRVESLESSLEKLKRNLTELRSANKSTLRTLELQLENAQKGAQSAEVNADTVTEQYDQSWSDFYKSAGLSLEGIHINLDSYEQTATAILNPNRYQSAVGSSFSSYLGARDSLQRNDTINLYNSFRSALKQEKAFYEKSLPVSEDNVQELLNRASQVTDKANAMLIALRTLLDNSLEGGDVTGAQISAHKSAVISAQALALKDISSVDGLYTQLKTLERNQGSQTITAQNSATIAENQLSDAKNALAKFKVSSVATEKDMESQIDQTQRDLISAQADYDSAVRTRDIQLSAKNLELNTLENQVKLAEKSFSDTTIYTPIDGTVSQVLVDEGDYISPGTLIGKVIQSSEVKVVFYLPEGTAGRLNVGMPVSLSAGVLHKEGTVAKIAPSVDPISHKVQIEAKVDNSDGLLRPDTFVNINMDVSDAVFEGGKLYIPLNAILVGQNENHVFVVEDGPDGPIASTRIVEIGAVTGKWVEVKSGLSKSDTLISAGQRNVAEGERVQVKNDL